MGVLLQTFRLLLHLSPVKVEQRQFHAEQFGAHIHIHDSITPCHASSESAQHHDHPQQEQNHIYMQRSHDVYGAGAVYAPSCKERTTEQVSRGAYFPF